MSAEAAHGPAHYKKIWVILLVLLAISFVGPLAGIQWLTLVTAFGIAVVKAWMVMKHFMHITEQPRFIGYIIATCVVFMFLFFAGTAGDVMNQKGDNWYKPQVEIAAPAPH
jgi:caa(3)-type oxidase subunit IV